LVGLGTTSTITNGNAFVYYSTDIKGYNGWSHGMAGDSSRYSFKNNYNFTGTEVLTLFKNGRVGVGATDPAAILHVQGNGSHTSGQDGGIITSSDGSVAIKSNWPTGWGGGLRTFDILCASIKYVSGSTSSDMRLKTNIETYNRGVTEVMRLRPVSFLWKDHPNKGTQYGFIAQEVEQILPELILEDGAGFKSIMQGFDAILVNCIQEQQEMIETLQNTMKTLEARLDAAGL